MASPPRQSSMAKTQITPAPSPLLPRSSIADSAIHPLATPSEGPLSLDPSQFKDLLRSDIKARLRLSSHEVPQSEEGIQTLAAQGEWKEVIRLCQRLMENSAIERVLALHCSQITALMKMRLYDAAAAELDSLGDITTPDPKYRYDSPGNRVRFPGRTGSLVPFTLLVIHAEMPRYQNKPRLALERLYTLLNFVRDEQKKLGEGSTEVSADAETLSHRESRLISLITNHHCTQREYSSALQLYLPWCNRHPKSVEMWSSLGRVLLQMGDLANSHKTFQYVETLVPVPEESAEVLLNRGYSQFAQGLYPASFDSFNHALHVEPSNVQAANNRAVCLLYMCNLGRGITALEDFVKASPFSLDETMVSNLCAMYDVETENAVAGKKKALMGLAQQCMSDDFVFPVKL